jgi:hypothetical protein
MEYSLGPAITGFYRVFVYPRGLLATGFFVRLVPDGPAPPSSPSDSYSFEIATTDSLGAFLSVVGVNGVFQDSGYSLGGLPVRVVVPLDVQRALAHFGGTEFPQSQGAVLACLDTLPNDMRERITRTASIAGLRRLGERPA